MKNKTIKYFFIAVIALIIIIYIFPKVSDLFTSSYTLEYGELKLTDDAEACFVRDETVYLAGDTGKSNYYIADNSLVRKNTVVMDYSEGTSREISEEFKAISDRLGKDALTGFLTATGGIVSFYADGYEGKLNTSTITEVTYEKFKQIEEHPVVELKREELAKGEPAFKVVYNDKWYLVCFTDLDSSKRFTEDNMVTVEFDDDEIEGYIVKTDKSNDKLRVIVELEKYYENFARKRTDDVKLTTYKGKGLIVDNESIVKKKKQEGVYVRSKTGDYHFVPVQIRLTDGKKSLVASQFFYDDKGIMTETVEIYDEILKHPKK